MEGYLWSHVYYTERDLQVILVPNYKITSFSKLKLCEYVQEMFINPFFPKNVHFCPSDSSASVSSKFFTKIFAKTYITIFEVALWIYDNYKAHYKFPTPIFSDLKKKRIFQG